MNENVFKVAAFYTFVDLLNLVELQRHFSLFKKENIKGTVLLANEGVNGTVAGTELGIERFKSFLKLHNLYEPRIIKLPPAQRAFSSS